ncbi:Piso0_005673 [Millerozyma farinosa CBS 7064]|uniref:Piso0_005673 protein n=1 Tax=Pichia sorbitophila (strain ATCC MYA-4447 / BCRC 22081 / CBS 7064 / NBRC 10061 / NRRL Y-12695) TaxID=559304 RepID=G8XZM5_PICSO|nr:Piso0_005673 [Millerozyma farinosa CBS 7064]
MTNFLHPPETPRCSKSGARANYTPSFSFGLGFSPSFHFGSPMNVLPSFSPQRMFQVSNNLNRILSNDRKDREFSENHKHNNVFNSLTPPQSSKGGRNRFFDSLIASGSYEDKKVEQNERDATTSDSVSSNEESTEDWSVDHGFYRANKTELTSICEEAPVPDTASKKSSSAYLSPRRLTLQQSTPITKKYSSTDCTPSGEVPLSHSRDASLSQDMSAHKDKKRRISSVTDSSLSSVDSDAESRKRPNQNSQIYIDGMNSQEKVWNPDLDSTLMEAYLKFRNYKGENQLDSSVLKITSQNKILSKMLYEKTGVHRTSKQIASRLFRLTRLKKGNKLKISHDKFSSEEFNNIIQEPLEHLIKPTTKEEDNSDILGSLLTSSPVADDGKVASRGKSAELTPKQVVISFVSDNSQNSHVFTSHKSTKFSNLSSTQFSKLIPRALHSDFTQDIISTLISHQIPVMYASNCLSLSKGGIISKTPGSDTSPFSISSMNDINRPLNLENGHFNAFIRLNASLGDTYIPDMLQWKCLSKVFNQDKLILKKAELINGYFNDEDKSFDMHLPFLKDFWSGFLSFLNDGVNARDALADISIIQLLYEGDSINKDSLRGAIVHKFQSNDDHLGTTEVTVLKLTETVKNQQPDDDDNATDVAYSSPRQSSPYTHTIGAKSNPNLKIDVSMANTMQSNGPFSAPIYDAKLVQKYCPNASTPKSDNGSMSSQCQIPPSHQFNKAADNTVHQNITNPASHPDPFNGMYPSRSSSSLSPLLMQARSVHNGAQVRCNSDDVTASNMAQQPYNISRGLSTGNLPNEYFNSRTFSEGFSTSTPVKANSYGAIAPVTNALEQAQRPPNYYMAFNGAHMAQMPLSAQGSHFNPQVYGPPITSFPVGVPKGSQDLQRGNFTGTVPGSVPQPYMAYQQNTNFIPAASQNNVNTGKTSNPTASKSRSDNTDKENVKPKEIKFGPILEYDPSVNFKPSQKTLVSNKGIGIHKFPVNTPVSIYKPKKT